VGHEHYEFLEVADGILAVKVWQDNSPVEWGMWSYRVESNCSLLAFPHANASMIEARVSIANG
jgi:hypothetical protein